MFRTLLVFVFLLSAGVQAAVVHSSDQAFELRIEATVPVPAQQAYAQFLRIGEWWNSDHTWFGRAERLSLEPRAGGCFCEIDGDRSALHMTVTYVDPGKEVRLVGGLGPLQGMALHGAMSWSFEALGPSSTRIVHSYRVMGYDPAGLRELAVVVDRVQTLQFTGLTARLEAAAKEP